MTALERQGIVIYASKDNSVAVEMKIIDDTVWLNGMQMAQLFGRDIKTIGKHVNNAFCEKLAGTPDGVNSATTAGDDKVYQVEHYNLDMIPPVGCRMKPREGTLFRRWANTVLKPHLIQGYTANPYRHDADNRTQQAAGKGDYVCVGDENVGG